jgi:pimeloyl-ACP methyl ester carboxylesterase
MAATNNVEVIIIPGSFALPPPYDILVDAFKANGYNARTVALLSANDGTRFPAATMQDDAAEIRSAVLSTLDSPSEPRNVVLAVHSYAGFPGSEALKGLDSASRSTQGKSTSVVGLVAIASFLPQVGECIRDVMGYEEGSPASEQRVPGGYLASIPPDYADYLFNDVADPAERLRLHATMTRHSSDSFDGQVSYAAWRDVPTLQIIPAADVIVPVPTQEMMYERAKAVAPGTVTRVVYDGAGHCYLWVPGAVERTVADVVRMIEADNVE